jgi:2-keto-4-pentenoate hydratase/2-oxohepta-3-ene-1,7-dioic acid hydratase in catechol pathway
MAFTFEELSSFASRGAAVTPGDLLASGTCQRGCLTEIWGRAGERVPPPQVPGDVVTRATKGSGRHAVPWALARASVMAFAPPCEVCPPSTGISAPLR